LQADGRRGGVRAGLWASRRRDPRPVASVPRGPKKRGPWRLRRRRSARTI